MKRFVFLIVLSVLCMGFLYGQQLTRVGLVDLQRVYTTFYSQSREVREFNEKRAAFEREIANQSNAIRTLQQRRADAIQRNDQAEVTRLEREINTLSENLRNFHATRTEQLENESRNLTRSESFLNTVNQAVRFVAESEGYTLIFDSKATPGILWNSQMIDITDTVIRRLQTTSR